MRAIGPLLLCVALLAATGIVHGVWTDRWRPSAELVQSVGRLDQLPREVGDWRGEDIPVADDLTRAGIQGLVRRDYRNRQTREVVSVLLVCGRGGPISVHTPDVCYVGAGYQQLTDARAKELSLGADRKATFNVARFGKPGVAPGQLEIYWAWSRDGREWSAPANPRVSFARLPALYKLYVVREVPVGPKSEAASPCDAFLRRTLADFGAALSPGP